MSNKVLQMLADSGTNSETPTEGSGEPDGRKASQKSESTACSKVDDQLRQLLPKHSMDTEIKSSSESVRTTFELSPDAIQLFDHLSDRTGKTQKDLLGDVLRLSRTALSDERDQVRDAASRYQMGEEGSPKTTKKSMAIAPETRAGLNELAEREGLSRNQLVEMGIRLVKLSLEENIRKKISPQEDILEDLKTLYDEVEEVQLALTRSPERSRSDDYEDPIRDALFEILSSIRSMVDAIEKAVESKTPIDEDQTFT